MKNMKLNSIRYVVVSLVALFAVVGAVNAVGVFYYDAAANQFVLDGSLKISDPGSFKLLLRELNSTDNSELYINGRKDVQIRLDADNDNTSEFRLNNGVNTEVFSVDEIGKINDGRASVFGGGATFAGNAVVNGALTATGAVSLGGNTTIGGHILLGGNGDLGNNGGNYGTPIVIMPFGGTIAWGNGWQFGDTNSANGFWFWGDSGSFKMTLTHGGDLSPNRLCLGGVCNATWPTGGTGTADGNSFGGMFAVTSTSFTPGTNAQYAGCASGTSHVNAITGDCTCASPYTIAEAFVTAGVRIMYCYK